MKKVSAVLVLAAIIAAVFTACDGRTGNPAGSGYSLDLQPEDDRTVPNQVVLINCFVSDGMGGQAGGILLQFEAIDFGFISPTRISSSTDPTGLTTDLYFDPKGEYGICKIVVSSTDISVTSGDTAEIEVLPFVLNFSTASDTMDVNTNNQITCRLMNPVTGLQTGGVNMEFEAIDIGIIIPDALIKSDDNSLTGLQSDVFFRPTYGESGLARITAKALYTGTVNKVMGTDTTEVWVNP